jgi:hypothetical protein
LGSTLLSARRSFKMARLPFQKAQISGVQPSSSSFALGSTLSSARRSFTTASRPL